MKERLIGDDQLLVTADTSLGDALWDWVAADASRRAPDGWRIANIGGIGTQMGMQAPQVRLRRALVRRGPVALDPVPPVSDSTPGSPSRPATPTPPAIRPRPRSAASRCAADMTAPPSTRSSTRRSSARRVRPGRPAVRHPDQRLARGRPALLARARLAAACSAATDGQPVCVTLYHLDGLVLARAATNHSVNYRSVMVLGTAHLVTRATPRWSTRSRG